MLRQRGRRGRLRKMSRWPRQLCLIAYFFPKLRPSVRNFAVWVVFWGFGASRLSLHPRFVSSRFRLSVPFSINNCDNGAYKQVSSTRLFSNLFWVALSPIVKAGRQHGLVFISTAQIVSIKHCKWLSVNRVDKRIRTNKCNYLQYRPRRISDTVFYVM